MFVVIHPHLLPTRLAAAIRRFFDPHGTADFRYPVDAGRLVEATKT